MLLVVLALAGCATSLDDARTRLPRPAIETTRPPRHAEPPRFEDATTLASSFGTDGDAELAALVQAALETSPAMRASLARVRASWSLADQGRAARMPTVSAVASAQIGRSIGAGVGSIDARSVTLSLPVAYEVDLFGRFAADHQSDRFDAEATEADAEAAAIALAAEVAEAYYDVVRSRALRALLEAQKESAEAYLALVDQRHERGLVGDVDGFSQRRVVANLDAELALLSGTEQVALQRLATLLGTNTPPRVSATELALPAPLDASAFDASGIAERPDIRAAWLRIEALDTNVAASVRQALPTLRITATPGWTAVQSESQFGENSRSGFTWSVGGTLTVPIFDGLRSPSLVRERRARVEAAVADYETLLLAARAEVENAIVLEAQRRIALASLTDQRALAAQERASAESRYRAGLDSHVTVLLAMDAERALARAELEAVRALLSHRLQLVRALGGTSP